MSASSRFVPENLKDDLLKFLRHENGVDVYLDTPTGKEIFTGRPTIQGETEQAISTRLNAIVHEALDIEQRINSTLLSSIL